MRRPARTLAIGAALTLLATACGGSDDAGGDAAGGGPTKVKLQLQWVTQAQFAGYFAAVDQGFFRDEGLDVEVLEGGVDIVPQTVLAQGQADFAIAWVPKALASREQGAEITDVGQVFQRSGTLQVSFKDKGINGPADLQALQAVRVHRAQLERRRDRDAAGRGVGEHRAAAERHGLPGDHGEVP